MAEVTSNQPPTKLEHTPKKRFDLIAFLRKLFNPTYAVKQPHYHSDLSPQLQQFNRPRQKQQRDANRQHTNGY